MTDPGEYDHIEDSTWESFCEEHGHEPSDIEEITLRLDEDEELREEFDEWLAGGGDPRRRRRRSPRFPPTPGGGGPRAAGPKRGAD